MRNRRAAMVVFILLMGSSCGTEPAEVVVAPRDTAPGPSTTQVDEPAAEVVESAPVALAPVEVLLLDDEIQDWRDWLIGEPATYVGNVMTRADVANCPQLQSVNDLEDLLTVERLFGFVDVNDVRQIVGRAPDANTASMAVWNMINAEQCLAALSTSRPAVELTVTEQPVGGADAAAMMTIVGPDDFRTQTLFIAVGDIVNVLTFDEHILMSAEANGDDPVSTFAALAVQKITNHTGS